MNARNNLLSRLFVGLFFLAVAFSSLAGEAPCDHDHDHDQEGQGHGGESVDWLTGKGANLGGFLFPEMFAVGVFGDSTADPAGLATHDHDPQTHSTLQSLDLSAILELGRLSGFGTYVLSTDATGELNGTLEEGFLHYEVLEGVKVGGGQFFNSFGFQNERHPHAWDFVDQYLANGRMLNEGELTTQGGELIIDLPTSWQSTLTIGGGGVRTHAGEEHGHDEEAEFEADGANFSNWILSGNYRADYGHDRRMAGTASFAVGENGFGEITQVYGIGHEILWNPHDHGDGAEFGSGSLRWRSEAMFRNIEAIADDHGEHEHEEREGIRRATLDELGFYTMLQYGLCDYANLALRGEWVSGIDEMGLDERWRLSPALTAYLNDAKTIHTRLQYNYDNGDTFGSEHSIWLQIGIAWGGAPGHHGHEH